MRMRLIDSVSHDILMCVLRIKDRMYFAWLSIKLGAEKKGQLGF